MHLHLLERVEIFPIPLIGRRHVASFSLFNQSSFLIHTAQLGNQSLAFFISEHNLSVQGIFLWCLSTKFSITQLWKLEQACHIIPSPSSAHISFPPSSPLPSIFPSFAKGPPQCARLLGGALQALFRSCLPSATITARYFSIVPPAAPKRVPPGPPSPLVASAPPVPLQRTSKPFGALR